jgi:Ca2+-binding RTX toxin-like protein
MEYAILGNAAFFAVAFAMQMGWLSWDMLGFGQDDDDDDVAVKNPGPEPDSEDAKSTNYTASDYASEQVGTSGNDTLGTSSSTESVALFGLTGNDSLVGSSSDDYFEGGDAGNDTINAFSGNDAAHGSSGDDLFYGLGGGMTPFMAMRATIRLRITGATTICLVV